MAVLAGFVLTAVAGCAGTGAETDTGTNTAQQTESSDTGTDTEKETGAETDANETEAEEPDVFPTGDNIEIGIFWEPPHDFTTDEQYDWIRDANVTFIEVTNRDGAINKEVSDKQIKLASERGIKIVYNTGADGKNLLQMSEEQIYEYAKKLGENKTITGIHVIDEPAQPWAYAKVCAAIKRAGLMPRLNQLPYFATWVFDNYQGFLEDTIIAAGKENYGYLCYDQYPFPYNSGDPDMFYNLDIIRKTGLKYDVPTAFYIQSIGEGGNFRRTNGGEIRYHTSAGLAYGIKSMTYFTWWTTGFCDPKDYAIISPYGEKTDIYDDVTEVNADILKVGALLRRLDALEIYHTSGREQGITLCSEADVPIYVKTQKYGLIISLMQDRETGRDYIMLVNKNYKKEVSCEASVSDKITKLYRCTNGEYEPVDISSGKINIDFKPGGFALFAVGKEDDIVEKPYDTDVNKAKDKPVAVDHVSPGGGHYAYSITDGERKGSANAECYRSTKNDGVIEIDLLRKTEINRVDIYPAGTDYTRGETFPSGFTLSVSADGENYTAVSSETDYTAAKTKIPVFKFDKTECRYVRLTVNKGCETGGFEISEIEIYNDKGDIPLPDDAEYYKDATQVEAGENVARDKKVTVLSELGGDWRKENLTDGDRGSCYSSALNRHKTEDGVEWALIDLAAELEFNEVDVYPRSDGQNFPFDFRIEISDDGKNFTSVYECSVPDRPADGAPSVCRLDQTYKARYVRVYAYKLRDQKGFNDGHIFQASEIEIYKK